jgi:hypothetical protein
MVSALLMAQDAIQSFGNIVVEPAIDGIEMTNAQQALSSHRLGSPAIGDFQ